MSRPGREDLVMVGILVLAFVLFFWDAILLRGAFFVQDVMVQNYPFRDFYSQALKQWQLPLWHSGINCGFPLFAEGQAGVLYPFNLLTAFLLPTFAGITANVVFHMWLGAAGTYWYLRILSCAPAAALAGGLTYGFSGFLVVRAMSQNYIDVNGWMPFLFVLLELAFRTRQLSYLWGVSAVVGLQFLAGHPQATAYAVGAAALYGVFRALGQGARKRVIAAVVIMPLLGAALAAVQLLPTLELVQLSGRSGGLDFEEVAKMSLPPERLVTFLLPNAFGNPSTGSYWGQGAGFFIQLCPYIGVLPLLLALIALRERRDGVTAFFPRSVRCRSHPGAGQSHRARQASLHSAGLGFLSHPDALSGLGLLWRGGPGRSRYGHDSQRWRGATRPTLDGCRPGCACGDHGDSQSARVACRS